MSIHAMNWVWWSSQAKGNDRLILLSIADKADDDGCDAFPGLDHIAEKTLLSRRTIQYSIKALQTMGELSIRVNGGRGKHGHGGHKSNLYTVLIDCCQGRHAGVQILHLTEKSSSEAVDKSGGVQSGVQKSPGGVQTVAHNTSLDTSVIDVFNQNKKHLEELKRKMRDGDLNDE